MKSCGSISQVPVRPFAAAVVDPAAGYTCGVSSDLCTAPTRGSYHVTEAYAETLAPVAAE